MSYDLDGAWSTIYDKLKPYTKLFFDGIYYHIFIQNCLVPKSHRYQITIGATSNFC